MTDDSGDLQSLFLENWDDIFDEEGPSDGSGRGCADLPDHPDDEDDLMGSMTSLQSDENTDCVGDGKDESSSVDKDKEAASNGDSVKDKEVAKKRRSSKAIENAARASHMKPPSWHSEAADRPHREAMILEVARLLQVRKKTLPTNEWLKQLPHKARNLEERLYRNAASLEAYLDRMTLKARLKKLARIITKQFINTKGYGNGQQFRRLRSSDFSPTISNIAQKSLASSSNLSRDSLSAPLSIESLRNNKMESVPVDGGTDPLRREAAHLTRFPSVSTSTSGSSSFLGSHVAAGSLASNMRTTSLGAMGNVTNQHSVNYDLVRQTTIGNTINANNETRAQIPFNLNVENQKTVNTQLEKQYMDNILQQEELVRQLQIRGSVQQQQQQHVPMQGTGIVGASPLLLSSDTGLSSNLLPVNQQMNSNFLSSQTSFSNPATVNMSMGGSGSYLSDAGFPFDMNGQMNSFMPQPSSFSQQQNSQANWGSYMQQYNQPITSVNNNASNSMSNIATHANGNNYMPVHAVAAPVSTPCLKMYMSPPSGLQQQPQLSLLRQQSGSTAPLSSRLNGNMINSGNNTNSTINNSNNATTINNINNNNIKACGPNTTIAPVQQQLFALTGPNQAYTTACNGQGDESSTGPIISNTFSWF